MLSPARGLSPSGRLNQLGPRRKDFQAQDLAELRGVIPARFVALAELAHGQSVAWRVAGPLSPATTGGPRLDQTVASGHGFQTGSPSGRSID
jgi:hypothetical protein